MPNSCRFATMPTVLPIFALLSACAMFAPAHDEQVGTQTSAAYTAIGRLLSEAEYGAFSSPDTFAGALDRYAEADALLMTAAARAGGLPVAARPASEARRLLVGQITGCRDRVRALAAIHRREGIATNAGLTENARTACDLAARAANAMRR